METKSLKFQLGRFPLHVCQMEASAVPSYRPSPSKAVAHAQRRETEVINAGRTIRNMSSRGRTSLFLLVGLSELIFTSKAMSIFTPLIHKHTHIHICLKKQRGPQISLVSRPTVQDLTQSLALTLFFSRCQSFHALSVLFKHSVIRLLFPMRLISIENLASLALISYKALCELSQGCTGVIPLVFMCL